MHIVYLDEVKYEEGVQPFYWLCALAFPEEAIQGADNALSAIADTYFGTPVLDKANEFHAVHIVHGKGPYKGHGLDQRVAHYKELIDVISETPELGRIAIRIDPSKMVVTGHHEHMAFMFLVEKVDELMVANKSLALLIADHDRAIIGSNVSSLSAYKASGTQYAFKRDITKVVDGIHHTHSHHSRLLQLADIYTYTLAMARNDHSTYPRQELVEYAKAKGNVLFPTKYKIWPTDDSWSRR